MKITSKNKLLVISVAILLLAGAAGGFYYYQHRNDTRDIDPITGDGINYGPPAKQETANIDNEIKSDSEAENTYNKPKGKAVKPIIVSYGQTKQDVEVSARVPGVAEDGGTCTLTLTKGTDKVTAAKKATANVSDTSCGFITISNSKLSPGNWSATVSYLSDKYSGSSDTMTIKVK